MSGDVNVKGLIFTAGLGAVLGGLAGLGLSFTALSPLVVGGVIGSMFPVLAIASCIWKCAPRLATGNVHDSNKLAIAYLGTLAAISVGIGVGLAAAATAIFPGAMLGMLPAALTGAAIGAITPMIAILVMKEVIVPMAKEVNEYVISPIIEHFSSKGKGYKPV